MEAQLDNHPSADQLTAFAEGRLANVETEAVGEHVESCDMCTARVDQVAVDPESVLFSRRPAPAAGSVKPADPLVDDRLELQDVIGSGGMGVVYRAWQPALSRYVAVKHLHIPLNGDGPETQKTIARFQREVRALGRVRHPHLVSIYSSGVTDTGGLFYSMELIEGTDLLAVHRVLAGETEGACSNASWHTAVRIACGKDAGFDSRTDNEGLTYSQAVVRIVRQIATAVQCLHEAGLMHRDIKPGNIMVRSDGDHATLMDLGLAGLIDNVESRLTRSGQVAGTLPYISPEQFLSVEPSESSDIYNLGGVLWELITRRRLFDIGKNSSEAELMHRILHEDTRSLRDFLPDVSPDLEAIVLKCLEKQPERRYASVADFIADLDDYSSGKRVAAKRHNAFLKFGRYLRRHQERLIWLTVLVASQALLFAAIFLLNWTGRPDESGPKGAEVRVAAVIRDRSLVGYWPGEGTGSTATDNSPNGNHGALTGNTSRGAGAIGKAFFFDGDGDYIGFGRASKWNFLHDGSPFTIAGFVAPAMANRSGAVLSTIDETSTAELRQGFAVRLNGSGKLQFQVQGTGGVSPFGIQTAEAVEPEVFTPFAVTFDGSEGRIYLRGALNATAKINLNGIFAAATALDALSMGSIGTSSGPNGQPFDLFTGGIDELQIYNRALSESEVAYLASGLGGTPGNRPNTKNIKVVASTSADGNDIADGASTIATHSGQGIGKVFPAFPATHSAGTPDSFLTSSTPTGSIAYDLGTTQPINQIRVWNYHGAAYGPPGNGHGAKSVRLFGSNDPNAFNKPDHASWRQFAALTLARAPADGASSPYGEEHRFEESIFRFVRLQIDSNYGAPGVGLAEIQFLHTTRGN